MSEQTDDQQVEEELVETEVIESVPADFVSLLEAEETIAAEGVVPVRIIQPGWGSSGYYSTDLLRKVAEEGALDNAHMHWDHIKRDERPERSLNNWAGVVVEGSTKFEPNGTEGPGIYGRAYVFPHWRKAVESMRSHLGLSIVGKGRTKYGEAEGKSGPLFQTLNVKDVDFVTRPGAGGKISRQFAGFREQPPTAKESASEESETEMPDTERGVAEIDRSVEEIVKQALEANDQKWEERFNAMEASQRKDGFLASARVVVESSTLPPQSQARVIETLSRSYSEEADAASLAREAVDAEFRYIESFTPIHLRAPRVEEAMDDEKYEKSLDEALANIFGEEVKGKE